MFAAARVQMVVRHPNVLRVLPGPRARTPDARAVPESTVIESDPRNPPEWPPNAVWSSLSSQKFEKYNDCDFKIFIQT